VITGTGGLVKDGANTQILSGANTFSGPITINAGTLQVGAGATGTIAGTQAITNDGTLAFNQNVAQAVSGVISGSGALTKAGTGTLTLSAANTYGGATTINGGTVTLTGGADRLPVGTTVTLANAANTNLNLNGQNQTLVGLTGGGAAGGNVQLGAGTLTLNQAADNTYGGIISGNGTVTKNGAFNLTLTGNNSFSAGLNINAGTVTLSGDTAALAAAVPIANGGALVVNKNTALALNGNITGTGSLTKAGTGTLTLGGANAYAGGTTITGGTLLIGAAGALPDTGTVNIGAATLSTAGGAGGAGISETAGTLKINGSTIALGTGAHTLTFGGLDASTTGLTVTGWNAFNNPASGRLVFTSLPGGDLNPWLASVNFQGATFGGGQFVNVTGGFELIPVPEPGTVLGIAAAGLAGLGALRRRFRRKTEAAVAA
jgi:fibronectin-binding autotransporter adhesin